MRHLLFSVLVLWSFSGLAQKPVLFKSGEFTPNGDAEYILHNPSAFHNSLFLSDYYVILSFEEIPSKELFTNYGIELLQFLPEMSFFAKVPLNRIADLKSLGVKSIDPIQSKYKLDEKISGSESRQSFRISWFKSVKAQTVKGYLLESGMDFTIETISPVFNSLTLSCSGSTAVLISKLAFINWVEPAIDLQLTNETERILHKSNVLAEESLRNLNGESLNLGIWDASKIGQHIDFNARLNNMPPINQNANTDHATHVCGIMAGGGIKDPKNRGMVSKATIWSYNFLGNIVQEMDSGINIQNIIITQNSYAYNSQTDSCSFRGRYDGTSNNIDLLQELHPNVLQVFAAGNSQTDNCVAGGFRTVASGFQASKSTLVVGNIHSNGSLNPSSSQGPSRDNRIKPEISAYGTNVLSTQPNNTYGLSSGTSMSCPVVSGIATQLFERYFHNFQQAPEASVLKAIICNTADDWGDPGPDYSFGFGRINASKAVSILDNQNFLTDEITNGVTKTYNLNIPSASRIKVLITWMDPPAAPNANPSLINNLDLTVENSSTGTLLPLILDPGSPGANATQGVDNVNNIEQVDYTASLNGLFQIKVKGTSVPSGPQRFALTWYYDTPFVQVTFPNGGESIEPAKSQYITWDAVASSGSFVIEYTIDGQNWNSVGSTPFTSRTYQWIYPDTVTGKAKIRITNGSNSDQSDTTFSIIGITDNIIGTTCENQVYLKWNKVKNAGAYSVYMLNGYNWTEMGITNDTFFTVGNIDTTEQWFTVRARGQLNAFGERAIAVPFTPTGILPAEFISHPQDVLACPGNNITFSATAAGAGSINYMWQRSLDSGATWVNIITETDTLLGLTNVQVSMSGNLYRLSAQNSCQNLVYSNPARLETDTILQIVLHPLSRTFCISDTGFLLSQTNLLSAFMIWEFRDSTSSGWNVINGSNTNNLKIVIDSNFSSAYYRMKAWNTCGDTVRSDSALVRVSKPKTTFTFNKISGRNYAFEELDSILHVNFEWTFGDNSSSAQRKGTHTYAADGNYEVCIEVTDTFGCKGKSCFTLIIVSSGIKQITAADIKVYPNPGNGSFTIDTFKPGIYFIEINDLPGKNIYSEKRSGSSFDIKLENVNPGIYLLRISGGNIFATRKIIIE